MRLSLIVAVADNGVIGRDNQLPWHLPADLKRFKALTLGHAVIMGRRTFESIGLALPGRRNLVLSRDPEYSAPGIELFGSLTEALEGARQAGEVFVLGGAAVFAEALGHADRIYLTRVHAPVAGDTRFPELDPRLWRQVADEPHAADSDNPLAYDFQIWERRAVDEPREERSRASVG